MADIPVSFRKTNPQFTGLWLDTTVDAFTPQGNNLPSLKVLAGDKIWVGFKNAHLNVPKEFHNSIEVDPTCPNASYSLNGTGFRNCAVCAGVEYMTQTIEMLKVAFKLQNVEGEAGAGRLVGFKEIASETETGVFINPNGTASLW